MKYLQDYIQDKQTALFNKYNIFFAFSHTQLKEGLDKHDAKAKDYCTIGAGLCCPTDKAKEVEDGLDKIYIEGIAQDIAENGKKAIILRELNNHEAYYTHDVSSTYDSLYGYDVTKDMLWKLFNNKNYKLE